MMRGSEALVKVCSKLIGLEIGNGRFLDASLSLVGYFSLTPMNL